MDQGTKKCGKCGEVKLPVAFSIDRSKSDGLQSTCKVCHSSYAKSHYRRHKEHYTIRHKARSRTNGGRYTRLKNRHKERWAETEPMTREEYDLLTSQGCGYCNGPLPTAGYGVDRKDSRKGYELSNCVACCQACNAIKGRLPAWLYELVWAALVQRYPHLAHLENPWQDPKISWMRSDNGKKSK